MDDKDWKVDDQWNLNRTCKKERERERECGIDHWLKCLKKVIGVEVKRKK